METDEMKQGRVKGLLERLSDKEDVILGEGIIVEMERRGYCKGGSWVPEFVLDHPDALRSLHKDFAHCGTDVTVAATYFAHKSMLASANRHNVVEDLNRQALKIARQVANESGTLMAGSMSESMTFDLSSHEAIEETLQSYQQQVRWAVEEGADFLLAETLTSCGEAMLALQAIKEYGQGKPGMVSVVPFVNNLMYDNIPMPETARKLREAGAHVVGLNCRMGPDTIMPHIKQLRQAVTGPISCVPNPFRTSDKYPRMQDLPNLIDGKQGNVPDISNWLCCKPQIADFTKAMKELGVQVMGLCCGNQPSLLREMVETLGRRPPASKYSADMNTHFMRLKEGSQSGAWVYHRSAYLAETRLARKNAECDVVD